MKRSIYGLAAALALACCALTANATENPFIAFASASVSSPGASDYAKTAVSSFDVQATYVIVPAAPTPAYVMQPEAKVRYASFFVARDSGKSPSLGGYGATLRYDKGGSHRM